MQFVERKIQLRAYEIYEERGKSTGHALDDWLGAKADLKGSILRHVNAGRPFTRDEMNER